MEAFGINYIQIISYTAIFFIFFYFSKRFVTKVLNTVEERKLIIEQSLANAKQSEIIKAEKLKEADAEREKVLQEAYNHAKEIIEKAKVKETKIINEANKSGEVILENAKVELGELKEKSKQEGLNEAREIIAIAVKKAFESFDIDKKSEEELIENSLKMLQEK